MNSFSQNEQRQHLVPTTLNFSQELEWQYAWDVHCNGFILVLLIVYVAQFLLLPLLYDDCAAGGDHHAAAWAATSQLAAAAGPTEGSVAAGSSAGPVRALSSAAGAAPIAIGGGASSLWRWVSGVSGGGDDRGKAAAESVAQARSVAGDEDRAEDALVETITNGGSAPGDNGSTAAGRTDSSSRRRLSATDLIDEHIDPTSTACAHPSLMSCFFSNLLFAFSLLA